MAVVTETSAITATAGKNTSTMWTTIKSNNVKMNNVQGKKYVHTFTTMVKWKFRGEKIFSCRRKAPPIETSLKN